jgi:hypothetical protein
MSTKWVKRWGYEPDERRAGLAELVSLLEHKGSMAQVRSPERL